MTTYEFSINPTYKKLFRKIFEGKLELTATAERDDSENINYLVVYPVTDEFGDAISTRRLRLSAARVQKYRAQLEDEYAKITAEYDEWMEILDKLLKIIDVKKP